jgi:hypothetical protein
MGNRGENPLCFGFQAWVSSPKLACIRKPIAQMPEKIYEEQPGSIVRV